VRALGRGGAFLYLELNGRPRKNIEALIDDGGEITVGRTAKPSG